MLTPSQRQTITAIVDVFETSQVPGDYARVSRITGDSGGLSYGRLQVTRGSGNLHRLVEAYCAHPLARWAFGLQPFLPALEQREAHLDTDRRLGNWLRVAADDLVMRELQDDLGERLFLKPALRAARSLRLSSALALAVVYDSHVHGSWGLIRGRTQQAMAGDQDERRWIARYVELRHDWLAGHSRADLRATTYRMQVFADLIALGLWDLPLPLVVRGQSITLDSLNGSAPGVWLSPAPGTRTLALEPRPVRGLDVRLLQMAISLHGDAIVADGIFGPATARAVRALQRQRGWREDGVLLPDAQLALLGEYGLV